MKPTVAALLAIGLIAAGCSDDPGSSDGKKRIRFQVSGEVEETQVYRTMEAAFEKENPDVDIELIEVAEKDEHLQKLTTSFAAGDPPDVFLVNFREYSQFVARGAIEPVGPHLPDAGVDLANYFEQPVEAFTYDGELQCMPQNVSSLVVYYNKTLLQAAGLDRPEEGWDWSEFRDYALAMNDPEAGIRGLGIDPNIIRMAPFVWSNGGDIVDDLENPTRFTLEEPAARAAVEFIVSLVRDDEVVPTEEEIAAQDLETRFATGKLGMILSSRRDTPFFREAVQLDWDVAALPVAGEPVGILHSDAYCVSRGTENLDAVMGFIGFALGSDGQTITALGGRTVPSLIAVAESGAFLNPAEPPEHSEVFVDAVPLLRRTPVLPTWPEIEDVAEEVFTKVFYEDGYSLDDGLRELDELTQPLFAEGAEG